MSYPWDGLFNQNALTGRTITSGGGFYNPFQQGLQNIDYEKYRQLMEQQNNLNQLQPPPPKSFPRHMSEFYILEGRIPKRVNSLYEWGRMLENTDARTVARDMIAYANAETKRLEQIEVSTVFLGINHRFGAKGDPILFETMVFGGPMNEYQVRYCTWDEAEEGHKRVMNEVIKAIGGVAAQQQPQSIWDRKLDIDL